MNKISLKNCIYEYAYTHTYHDQLCLMYAQKITGEYTQKVIISKDCDYE